MQIHNPAKARRFLVCGLSLWSIVSLSVLLACGGGEKQNVRGRHATVDPDRNSGDGKGERGTNSGTKKPGNKPGGDGADGGKGPENEGENGNSGSDNESAHLVRVGIRNFQQINATMAALTGIPTTNATVLAKYEELSTSLPTDNDVQTFNGANQVSVFKLAVEYCDALSQDTVRRASVYGTFNFAAAPAVAFSESEKRALADALVTRFWGKDLTSLPPHDESIAHLTALIDSILNSKPNALATLTPGLVTAVCTAALASAPVTLF